MDYTRRDYTNVVFGGIPYSEFHSITYRARQSRAQTDAKKIQGAIRSQMKKWALWGNMEWSKGLTYANVYAAYEDYCVDVFREQEERLKRYRICPLQHAGSIVVMPSEDLRSLLTRKGVDLSGIPSDGKPDPKPQDHQQYAVPYSPIMLTEDGFDLVGDTIKIRLEIAFHGSIEAWIPIFCRKHVTDPGGRSEEEVKDVTTRMIMAKLRESGATSPDLEHQ
jgi:hypothetical protein